MAPVVPLPVETVGSKLRVMRKADELELATLPLGGAAVGVAAARCCGRGAAAGRGGRVVGVGVVVTTARGGDEGERQGGAYERSPPSGPHRATSGS